MLSSISWPIARYKAKQPQLKNQLTKSHESSLPTIGRDKEHILLDCPHEHLVRLRTQQQLTFPPQFEDDPARLRTFLNQPDIFGVASFVAKCLALLPCFF